MRSVSEIILIAHKETPHLEGEYVDILPDEFKEWTKDVWIIPPVRSPLHPAVFTEELAKRLIKLFSFGGQVVLDPFCGIGTTGKICVKLKRNFIGYDVSPNYCKVARWEIKNAIDEFAT